MGFNVTEPTTALVVVRITDDSSTAKSYLLYFLYIFLSTSSSSFEGYPLQVRHKQDWGRGFILLLPKTVAMPGSDAGSDVIKPASSFVIQNRQTSCTMWCPMYCIGHAVSTWSSTKTGTKCGLRFSQKRHTRNSVKERGPICAWTNGIAQHQSAGG